MSKAIKMKALMSLPARGDRKAVSAGKPFEVGREQEARDLEQFGQAERVPAEQAVSEKEPAQPKNSAK